jgi:hypothetical protein
VTETNGGIADFPDAFTIDEYAPLMVEVGL